ncbi:MAG: hypothetical protein Q8P20_08570 [bacterium]|nr:hypothetical protein [bacterium]
MNKIDSKKIIVGIVILFFIFGAILSFNLSEEAGSTTFAFLIIGIVIVLPLLIWSIKIPKIKFDTSAFDISYKYYQSDFMPKGSIIFTIASLIWLFISQYKESGTNSALAFVVGFGFLSFFELMYRWWKVTKYNDFTFSYNNHGVVVSKHAWKKELIWSNYSGFSTLYKARFGKWINYIPIFSMLVHDSDQNLINLYRKKEYRKTFKDDPFIGSDSEIHYDRIATLPNNHMQVINYIKQFLPEENKLSLNKRL